MPFHIASGLILIVFSIILIRKKRALKQVQKHAQYLLRGNKPLSAKLAEGFVLFTNYPFIILWFLTTIAFFDHVLFDKHIAFSILGILLMIIGVVIYGISVFQLGIKWRVGIDYDDNDYFVKTGLYAFSRHPAYLGFYFLFTGIMFHYASYAILILGSLSIAALFIIALEEEKYLVYKFGKEYQDYQKKVRFILGRKQK